jgi:hypothetical protein
MVRTGPQRSRSFSKRKTVSPAPAYHVCGWNSSRDVAGTFWLGALSTDMTTLST